MPRSSHSRARRLAVGGRLLGSLLVGHVTLQYLISVLFGYVTYRGLDPVVPWLILGSHMLLFVVVEVAILLTQGQEGVVLIAGLLLLSTKPLTSAFIWGDGCEVGASAGDAVLPEATIRAGAVKVNQAREALTAVREELEELGLLD